MKFLSPLSITRIPAQILFLCVALSLCACSDKSGHRKTPPKKLITSGRELFTMADFSSQLSVLLPKVDTLDTMFRKKGVTLSNGLAYAYQQNNHEPFWLEEKGVTEAAGQLLAEIDSLQWDGLNTDAYNLPDLRRRFNELKKGDADLKACIAFDTACTHSYLRASHDLLFGSLVPRKADSLWFHVNDAAWTAIPLFIHGFGNSGVYPSLDSYKSALPAYGLLRQDLQRYTLLGNDASLLQLKAGITGKTSADTVVRDIIRKELPWVQTSATDTLSEQGQWVRAYQNYYGLNPNGKLDSVMAAYLAEHPDSMCRRIAANMERMRWLPRQLETEYVLVNIPLMELVYRKGDVDAYRTRVVVGKPSRQTPVLNANMANIVFSPSWGVPPTILKKDVLPGITKRGASYLASKGLKAYNRHGEVVHGGTITAGNYRNYTFRQPPGERNALGEVKFNLPNQWDIYLHDTPHKEDFPRRYRAKSSGCIRVEQPREFAAFILNDLEGRNFDQQIIDSIIQTRHTRYETLHKKIPVHIVYLTACEDATGQHLRYLPDIYHRDAKLIATLYR